MCWVLGMPSRFVTPELVVQGPAILLEVGPFLSSGVCEPGIQQEVCLSLEYSSEHCLSPGSLPSVCPMFQMLPHPWALQQGCTVQLSRVGNVGIGEQCCNTH